VIASIASKSFIFAPEKFVFSFRPTQLQLHSLLTDNKMYSSLEKGYFMQFIQQKDNNEQLDLLKASESTLDFWNNDEDSVWDNV
jgi:hypothetical protein